MSNPFKQDFLKGKTAFITGGATGICYVIGEQLLKHGCNLCIMSRKQQSIDKAVESLKQSTGNPNVYGHKGDVRNPKDIEVAVDFFISKFGKIDILVNGAAGNFLAPLDQLSPNGFKTVIDIDLLGTYNTTKIVYDKSLKQHGGNIINISAWLHGVALQSHAGAAKAGIDNLTKAFAVELGPKKIRVNGIVPGSIAGTEGLEKLSKGQKEGSMEGNIPLLRLGQKEDIANAALFLSSDAASYVSGQNIVVDGGALHVFPNFPLLSPQIKDMWAKAKL